jgi:hypothetical protein
MISRALKSFALVVVVVILAACAKLPSSSVDQLGPEVSATDAPDSLYYSPAGPSDGASQEQIINGFLYAGNGPQDDYAVARKFLTLNNSSKWHPSDETLIQSGPTKVLSNSGTKIRLKVNYNARVLADGTYLAEPGSSRILEFRLLQENGQWRISSAPDLTSLLSPNFSVLFKAVPVYFWDKSFSYLVPDLRWFPTRASLATRLANALISGPNGWLAPAVQNILLPGTKLNINSVTIDNGIASIDFNSLALKVPAWKRPYLRSQLLATLGSVPGVTQVSISVERTVQVIGVGASGMPETSTNLPVILTKDGLSHIAGTTQIEIRGTKDLLSKQPATAFAISSDETLVVLLGTSGATAHNLGLLNNSSKPIDSRKQLLTPNIDTMNNIWTVSKAPGSAIKVTDVSGSQVALPNPLGNTGLIRAIAVSSEGARLAILHSVKGVTKVDLFSVIRDKSRRVVGLGPAEPMNGFSANVQSISWQDQDTLVGLERDKGNFQTSVTVMIGGPAATGRATVSGSTIVTVLGGGQYFLDSTGGLFVSNSFGWDFVRSGVISLRMAGQ